MVQLVSEEKTIAAVTTYAGFITQNVRFCTFFTLKTAFLKTLFEISNNEFKRGRENEVRAGDGKLKINFQGPKHLLVPCWLLDSASGGVLEAVT